MSWSGLVTAFVVGGAVLLSVSRPIPDLIVGLVVLGLLAGTALEPLLPFLPPRAT